MIYAYKNYKEWLKAELNSRQKINPSFSLTAFAKKLNMSQSYLSLILEGQRPLTEKAAKKISQGLKLSQKEETYLVLILKAQNESSLTRKKELELKRQQFLHTNSIQKLDLVSFDLISGWEHSAILEALETKSALSSKDISTKFGLKEQECKKALERLLELKLAKKTKQGYKKIQNETLEIGNEILSKGLRNFHGQILEKGKTALEAPVDQRHFIGSTLKINKDELPAIKNKINQFVRDLVLEFGKGDHVYQFSSQLFSLEKVKGEENEA